MPLEQLPAIVKEFFVKQKQNGESCLAYKGGHLERDLLRELEIPSVNLEDLGCPKADKLFNQLASKKPVESIYSAMHTIIVQRSKSKPLHIGCDNKSKEIKTRFF